VLSLRNYFFGALRMKLSTRPIKIFFGKEKPRAGKTPLSPSQQNKTNYSCHEEVFVRVLQWLYVSKFLCERQQVPLGTGAGI